MNNLKDAIKSDDGERIKKTMDILLTASQKLGEEMYKAAGGGAAGAAPGGPEGGPAPEASTDRGTAGEPKKDEDVIDAEFEVKE